MMFIVLIAIFILSALTYLVLYARWNIGKLNGLGFPVMEPAFLKGSVPQIHTEVPHLEDIERFKKYGPVWGLYQGRHPIVYVADPDLIRQIFVKDTNHFFDRKPFDFGNPILNEILDYLPGSKWKTMRVMQTKLFSSGKIKQYSNDIFADCVKDFMKTLDADLAAEPNGKLKIDTRGRFCTYTVDAIARSMLSIKAEPNSKFYKGCLRLIGEGQEISSNYIWTQVFPFLAKFEPTLILDDVLIETFSSVLSSRSNSNQKFDDFADILSVNIEKSSTPEYKKLGITETTLLGQAANLFLAGFDRISSIMTFLAYHLAQDPDIQARVHEEIDEVVEGRYDGKIDYDIFSDMPYLNACISETLRLYPTLIRPERVCNKDWTDPEKGIRIPEGVIVMIPAWASNRNPDVYENPDEFDPERFMPENKANLNPYAFSTFGFGHRNCIGTRFAWEALKVSMCNILRKYKFETSSDTQVKFKPGAILIYQFYPVYLNISKRE